MLVIQWTVRMSSLPTFLIMNRHYVEYLQYCHQRVGLCLPAAPPSWLPLRSRAPTALAAVAAATILAAAPLSRDCVLRAPEVTVIVVARPLVAPPILPAPSVGSQEPLGTINRVYLGVCCTTLVTTTSSSYTDYNTSL